MSYSVWSHGIEMPNADVADDHYHRMPSDLAYLKKLGATAYRFSISWPRILPNCTGPVNQKGIQFYSDMIDNIIANGAEPYLTMFHWDLPQVCQERYGGFINAQIVDDFVEYASVLFKNYGDRVKYWLTVNELEANCKFGWSMGLFAPGVQGGLPNKFSCMRFSHLIHGKVVQYARKNYPASGWQFGLPAIMSYYMPIDAANKDDIAAADYIRDLYGFAPDNAYVVPFTDEDKAIMKGTSDFIALNYYSAGSVGRGSDGGFKYDNPKGSYQGGDPWQNVYAPGLRGLLSQVHKRYPGLDIHITEIGTAVPGEDKFTKLADIVDDPKGFRLKFWQDHVSNLMAAITEDKIPVKSFLGDAGQL
ncbi:hypothetical protein HDU76_011376 [Blyttiomyces sp. JEL0837]|nr:hypothetical protein HDU76_011376 [Blyttiomyces sp. JEL0837]